MPVVIIDVRPSPRAVYVETKSKEILFVRANNTTREMPVSEIHDYISQRWTR